MSQLESRIAVIFEEISAACRKVGRDPSEIKLIAVSKNFAADQIKDVYDLGLKTMGENRVQELKQKKPHLPEDIEWHLIGTLQRNKVKDVVGQVALIHSVDSIALASEVSRQAVKRGIETEILLQVNVAGEARKHGFSKEEVLEAVREISSLGGIKIRGLMTIAPLTADPELVRPVFSGLRELSSVIKRMGLQNVEMKELSMGMSNDFKVAIEEGATMIRVGSRIFGERL